LAKLPRPVDAVSAGFGAVDADADDRLGDEGGARVASSVLGLSPQPENEYIARPTASKIVLNRCGTTVLKNRVTIEKEVRAIAKSSGYTG
jgi:hypothetical protein